MNWWGRPASSSCSGWISRPRSSGGTRTTRTGGGGTHASPFEATIAIGFHGIHLHRIEAGIEPENTPSVALAEAVGMRREGIQRKYGYFDNRWNDFVAYAIVAEDLGIDYGAPRIRARFCLENF